MCGLLVTGTIQGKDTGGDGDGGGDGTLPSRCAMRDSGRPAQITPTFNTPARMSPQRLYAECRVYKRYVLS